MKKRGERFGITPPCLTKVANALIDHTRPPSFPATTIQVEEEDRKRKRMERFGMTVTELSSEASVCSNNVWSTIYQKWFSSCEVPFIAFCTGTQKTSS